MTTMHLEPLFEENYSFNAAGRIWIVRRLQLVRLPDDTVGMQQSEIDRVHRAIGNQICGDSAPLNPEELEFLCDITLTKFSEAAKHLGLHKSTITKWRKQNRSVPEAFSLALKRWFWFKLFGPQVRKYELPFEVVENDSTFLEFAKEKAIREQLTGPIFEKVA